MHQGTGKSGCIGASLEAKAEAKQEILISLETYARHLAECGRYDRIAKLYEELASLPDEDRTDVETSLLATPVMVNSLGMEFSLMPHLRFKEKVPIFFGVYEVTGEQYSTITGSDPSKHKGRALPVEQVTLDDAREFCKRLSALPLEKRLGRVYRLPQNLEWETASRAGAKTKLYFGDNASRSANFAWLSGNAKKSPRAVGRLQKNAWGSST